MSTETKTFEEAVARAFGYGALQGETNYKGFVKALERGDAKIRFELEETTFAGACGFGPKDGATFVADLRSSFEAVVPDANLAEHGWSGEGEECERG